MTYEEFIESIKNGRINEKFENSEEHHIIPKCMGGTNDKDNLIYLSMREHFIAHKLLAEEHPNNQKLCYAFWMMCGNRKVCTPEEYEEAKLLNSKHAREINLGNKYCAGKSRSEEVKQKIKENHADFSGVNNPNYGKHKSKETRLQIQESNKKTWSDPELRKKLSDIKNGQNTKIIFSPELNMTFNGAKEAAKYIGLKTYTKIYDCIKYRRKSAGKHPITGEKLTWVYLENK